MMQRVEDTQYLGMENKHSLTCCICGADLPMDPEFQGLHFEKEHGLIACPRTKKEGGGANED